ncbi:MAG: hypothetical protein ACT4O9_02500 [Blastocatellia bacterium]
MEETTQVIELTFEKSEKLLVRHRHKKMTAWCERCGKKVEMLSPEEAAAICNMPKREIYRDIEAGRFHFIEPMEGSVLICLESLLSTFTALPLDVR